MRIARTSDMEWRDAFAVALIFLAAFTDAKVGTIQLAEFFTIAFVIWHFVVFYANRSSKLNILGKVCTTRNPAWWCAETMGM